MYLMALRRVRGTFEKPRAPGVGAEDQSRCSAPRTWDSVTDQQRDDSTIFLLEATR